MTVPNELMSAYPPSDLDLEAQANLLSSQQGMFGLYSPPVDAAQPLPAETVSSVPDQQYYGNASSPEVLATRAPEVAISPAPSPSAVPLSPPSQTGSGAGPYQPRLASTAQARQDLARYGAEVREATERQQSAYRRASVDADVYGADQRELALQTADAEAGMLKERIDRRAAEEKAISEIAGRIKRAQEEADQLESPHDRRTKSDVVLGALSIALGAVGDAFSAAGGRNSDYSGRALDIINASIERDLASQREEYQRAVDKGERAQRDKSARLADAARFDADLEIKRTVLLGQHAREANALAQQYQGTQYAAQMDGLADQLGAQYAESQRQLARNTLDRIQAQNAATMRAAQPKMIDELAERKRAADVRKAEAEAAKAEAEATGGGKPTEKQAEAAMLAEEAKSIREAIQSGKIPEAQIKTRVMLLRKALGVQETSTDLIGDVDSWGSQVANELQGVEASKWKEARGVSGPAPGIADKFSPE
jgi:hypothetical protein